MELNKKRVVLQKEGGQVMVKVKNTLVSVEDFAREFVGVTSKVKKDGGLGMLKKSLGRGALFD